MRVAFYAPLKSPDHAVPSGDRRVGSLLIAALELAGHEVSVVSTLRAYDATGNASNQLRIREAGTLEAEKLIAKWRDSRKEEIPQLWLTYHVYHKAPDWIGPRVAEALGIPYVIAEASFAPKRANGRWAESHSAVADAIRSASLVLCPTKDDVSGIALLNGVRPAVWLPPFIDAKPFLSAAARRASLREDFARRLRLDPAIPWIAVVAMMRPGDKSASYRMLSESLEKLATMNWHIVVGGDGETRAEVQAMLETSAPGRGRFLGQLDDARVADLYAASDLCAWPAVNEAYGMALLEAQAAGLPVVSRAVRGVPDVVVDGETGLLAEPNDQRAFVRCLQELLGNRARRAELGAAAADFVKKERDLPVAARRLDGFLAEAISNHSESRAGIT